MTWQVSTAAKQRVVAWLTWPERSVDYNLCWHVGDSQWQTKQCLQETAILWKAVNKAETDRTFTWLTVDGCVFTILLSENVLSPRLCTFLCEGLIVALRYFYSKLQTRGRTKIKKLGTLSTITHWAMSLKSNIKFHINRY